jgi:hypothetical protein
MIGKLLLTVTLLLEGAAILLAAPLFMEVPAFAQAPVINGERFSNAYGSTITLLPTTSGFVLLTSDIVVQGLTCTNIGTTSGVTVSVADGTGNKLVSAAAVTGNDVKTLVGPYSGGMGILMNGIEWWSNTANAIKCYLAGWLP